MRRLMAVLALAALVAACNDEPTAPPAAGNAPPAPTLMRTVNDPTPPGNGWTLLYGFDETQYFDTPDHPCLGPGMSVAYAKWWWWTKDFVVTPSGNGHATQRVTWADAGYVDPSEDVWEVQKIVQPLIANFQRQGAEWVAQNPYEVWYVNLRTGVRMKESVKYVEWYANYPEPPTLPNYTGFEVQHLSCQLMGR